MPARRRDDGLLDVALLDPRELVPHPRNVRTELVDLQGLTDSIAAQGVIEPLTVVQLEDGRYQLVTGHRRTAAAIAAGVDRVPCVIRRDLSIDAAADLVQAEHVGTMLAENLQREGLTVVEEAHGVQTMLDLGMDLTAVASRTGLDRKRVAKAAGVARLTPSAAAAVAGAGLTLDQAAVVARFEGDDGAVGALVAAAGEGAGRFAHAVTRAEKQRATERRLDQLRAQLEGDGHRVLVEGEAPAGSWKPLSDLMQGGEVLRTEMHADCPGAAVLVYVVPWGDDVDHRAVCTDPAGNGHTDRWVSAPRNDPGSSMSDEELERQRAERREVIANNQAMEAANVTRRAWLREYLGRRSAPREVLRFAVEALALYPEELYAWLSGMGTREGDDAVHELGLSRPTKPVGASYFSLTNGEHVVDGRLPLQLLAHVAAAIEASTPKDAWQSTGHDRDRLAGWLTFLVGQGYQLSDIEATVIAP